MSFIKKGYYDVPSRYSEEQALAIAPKYITKFGESLHKEGFNIIRMYPPVESGNMEQVIFCEPDTRRYTIEAQVARKPRELHIDVPDHAVPAMEKLGLVLQE